LVAIHQEFVMRIRGLFRSQFAALLFIASLVLGGSVLALDQMLAAPQPGPSPALDVPRKVGEDDDDDDDDDSGRGRGRGRGGDEDDDGAGDVARPVVPAAEMGDVVIEIIDERFVPDTATIDPGQRVTFINLDDDEHTATGIGFDTGTLNPGDWRTVTLTNSGEAGFVCQYHPEMQGTITVTGQATPVASPVPAADASPVAQPASEPVTIEIRDFAFATTQLEIPAGTAVIWVNIGVAPHTVTGPFGDSGLLQPGDTFSFIFSDPGSFDYVCQLHPQMTASITVTEAPAG
jgi:plastocyanin